MPAFEQLTSKPARHFKEMAEKYNLTKFKVYLKQSTVDACKAEDMQNGAGPSVPFIIGLVMDEVIKKGMLKELVASGRKARSERDRK